MFNVGDKVQGPYENDELVVYDVDQVAQTLRAVNSSGETAWLNWNKVALLATASYAFNIKVGDKVSVRDEEQMETGIVFAIDNLEKLPYSVGFTDGGVTKFSSKELQLHSVANYTPVVGGYSD